MKQKVTARLTLLNELYTAINESQLTVHYQPIHHTGNGVIAGVEALVRWRHPDKGYISPGDFIPVAEQTGLIGKIGEQVLCRALEDFSSWRKNGLCDDRFFLNINISPVQLNDRRFIYQLKKLCRKFAIAPSSIVLELTETVMMTSGRVSLQILRELAAMEFRIALDDFGSGYSSLNYLHKLPVDILKIDRGIIQQIRDGQAPLLRPIAEIARAFNFEVVAEGVENAMQMQSLKAVAVDFLQGFHLSRPMPAYELVSLLRTTPALQESA